jgi:hypothetical protein
MTVTGIKKNDTQYLLVRNLHFGAGSIDRFRLVERFRKGVLGFAYGRYSLQRQQPRLYVAEGIDAIPGRKRETKP